uniref:LuxR C-terminal-related transcriptional regulator n=1 Tax=Pseudomonas viridiflava TaxID=33069 RepID=UPI001F119696
EVLRLFVTGMRVSDIARHLSRSNKTVSAQKISDMRKLEVDSDQALLTYCIEARQFQ